MTQMPKKHVVEIYNITLGTAIGRWIERIAEHFFFFWKFTIASSVLPSGNQVII